jgi:hypothetical protein
MRRTTGRMATHGTTADLQRLTIRTTLRLVSTLHHYEDIATNG